MTDEQIIKILYPHSWDYLCGANLVQVIANARAIESAATAPLLERIADLERRVKLTADRWQVECDNKDERIAELEAELSQRVPEKITEEMHVAAVKVLHRASGVDGLPQRMLDAMRSAAPAAPEQQEPNPLECLHINRGSADAEADEYAAEYGAQLAQGKADADLRRGALQTVGYYVKDALRRAQAPNAQQAEPSCKSANPNATAPARPDDACPLVECKAIGGCAKVAQQAEAQEPVAKIVHASDECGTVEWLVHSGRPIRIGQPLFTRPQPAQLQRLSAAEYNQIPVLCAIRPSLYAEVVGAISAALAAKNGVNLK